MIAESILFAMWLQGGAGAPVSPPGTAPQPSACAQAMADALADAATGELCAGDEGLRLGDATPADRVADRTRLWRSAADHYDKAAGLTGRDGTRVIALKALATVCERTRLNDLPRLEATLRELVALLPGDFPIVDRLARAQEDQALVDAAETTLLDNRHQHPGDVEPNRMLAQFYARRVTAMHREQGLKEPAPTAAPGERDENGVYRVGGSLNQPARIDVPRYPADARSAGIDGVVVAEVVLDPSGNVTDAKVVRSIPLLDDAALQAVRNWRYTPTLVDGQAVPVRFNVSVNFTLPRTEPVAPPGPPAQRDARTRKDTYGPDGR